MTVLVTGASGFVGSHLVETLVARGDEVRCLLRPSSDRRWLPASATVALGSVDDAESLGRAVAGVDRIYHLAAVTSAANAEAYDRVNHIGMIRLLAAIAAQAPASRLVFCSSLAAGGPAVDATPVTESDLPRPITPYGESKLAAERAIAAASLDAVVVRPPAVYGPRDRDVLAAFGLAKRGLAVRTGPRGQQLAMIHVRDLVQGLTLAGDRGTRGGVYYINGGNYTWEAIVAAMGQAVGRRAHVVTMPAALLRVGAQLSRTWAGATGIKPLLTPERVRDLVQPAWMCDDARARRELGYAPTVTLESGMQDTATWYREQGWL
jgi:nucleoside-diphosphate-sugar epimerase